MKKDDVHEEPEFILFPNEPLVYATFEQRFAAWFIDGLIILVLNFVFASFLDISLLFSDDFSGVLTDDDQRGYAYYLVGYLPSIIISWLYYSLQESGSAQATLGKRAMGIKVTTLENKRISFGQATGRDLGKYLSAIPLFFGFLMMLWDDKKQTLHDKLAGTLVVKKTTSVSTD